MSIQTPRMRRLQIEAARGEELATRMHSLSPLQQLHKLADGNWWLVTLEEVDRHGDRSPLADVVLDAGLSDLPRAELYGRPRVYARAKRPLSSKEIKRYGLNAI